MNRSRVPNFFSSAINPALRGLLVLFALTLGASAQSPLTPIAVNVSPGSTNIHWTLNTNVHTVHGTFKLKSGDFKIDPATGNANGLLVIDATSGESGDSSRDKRMHTAIIESPKYPTITFRPMRVDGKIDLAAPGQVTVHGILNLHGQDHPLDLIVNLHPQGTAVALTTHFTVPFVAWGLKDPSTFVFRTDKQVILDVDATVSPFQTPPARANCF
jgi:polyisoprenoid-binding protein YceI